MNGVYQHVVTLGDIITSIIAAIALIPLFIGSWIWLREMKYPFLMRFLVEGIQTEYRRSYRTSKGTHLFTIELITRRTIDVSLIDIRFVNRKWLLKWQDVPPDTIKITEIATIDWGDGNQPFQSASVPQVGGFRLTPQYVKKWVARRPLYLSLKIEAHKPWQGYLSFEATADRRLYVRRPITVMVSATPF